MIKKPKSIPTIRWSPIRAMAEQDCACASEDLIPSLLRSSLVHHDDDCACPSFNPAPDAVPDAATLWQHSADLYHAPLPEDHELAFNPANPTGVAVLNLPARRILETFAAPRRLSDPIDSQLATLHLIQPANLPLADSLLTNLQPETLTAWLHVTNRCNLNCAYCYVHKNDETMSEVTGMAAVDAVFRSALINGFRAVKLKYAGGEPTLNFPLVSTLHDHAQTLAEDYGLALREVLLSNGVALSDEMLVALREMDMRLAISLDGVGAAHDALRGSGAFARTARSIERAFTLGLELHLSITVTAQNADALPQAVAYTLAHDLPFNLNFYREHCGGSEAVLRADNARLIEGMMAALNVIEENLPDRSVVGGLLDRVNLGAAHAHPCGAGRSYLVIDHQGRIARCQMTIDRPVTDVSADDPLQAVRWCEDGFQNVAVDEKEDCRNCTWRYWCAGGCPFLTHRVAGRSDAPSPYCAVYKALFSRLLRLEGLRLLNHSSDPADNY